MFTNEIFKERQTAELVEFTDYIPDTRICSSYKTILTFGLSFPSTKGLLISV